MNMIAEKTRKPVAASPVAAPAAAASSILASRAMLPVPEKSAEEKHPLSLPRGPLLLLGVLAGTTTIQMVFSAARGASAAIGPFLAGAGDIASTIGPLVYLFPVLGGAIGKFAGLVCVGLALLFQRFDLPGDRLRR